MQKHKTLKHSLSELSKLEIALEKRGGASEDGQLFEQILVLQDEILKSLGIPASPDNIKILWFKLSPTETEINEKINLLHQTAAEFLLSNARTDLKILKDALEINQSAIDILPELKIPTHTYTIFVYEKLFLRRKATPENILHELNLVNNHDILDALGKLEMGTLENEPESVEELKSSGLKYIEQFIIHNSNFLTDDDY